VTSSEAEEGKMRKRVLLAVAAAALAAVPFAPPLTASGDNEDEGRLVLTERMQLTSFNPATGEGTQAGTFVAAGAVNDAGSATAVFTATPSEGGCGVLTGPHTFTSSAGTITVFTKATICPFPPPPPRSFARGNWHVVGATGVYAGLRGRGKIFATADFTNGQITIARDGKVQRDE
jgi:hypothetical protein